MIPTGVLQPQQIATAAQERTGTPVETRGQQRSAEWLEGSVGPSPSGREEPAESSHPVKKPKKHLKVEVEHEGQWPPNRWSFPSELSLYATDESFEGEFLSDMVSQQPDTETGSAAPEGQMPSTAGALAGAVEHSAAEAPSTQVEPGFLVVKMHSAPIYHRLKQPRITSLEAVALIMEVRATLQYLTSHETHPLRGKRPTEVVRALSARFMCLDAVLSVIQVVGPPMNPQEWFPDFVAAIPTEYTPPRAKRNAVSWGNVRLAVRLSEALALLKQGIRPPAEVMINLKRDILHVETGATNLRGPAWDTWRSDDQNHQSSL
ncbi:hypothetical protein Efla_007737 [Eimeria flavescens]